MCIDIQNAHVISLQGTLRKAHWWLYDYVRIRSIAAKLPAAGSGPDRVGR